MTPLSVPWSRGSREAQREGPPLGSRWHCGQSVEVTISSPYVREQP
ncbi:hypothetical protein AB0G54_28610 [Streptomyces yokosukanensis]|nr:hypothetical protein [Streptomyces yokosukanensis]